MQIFLEAFPVFLEGEPPKKKDRERLVGMQEKACYDKWRDLQQKMRIKDVIGKIQYRL